MNLVQPPLTKKSDIMLVIKAAIVQSHKHPDEKGIYKNGYNKVIRMKK